ncbi:MAG: dimethylsulfoxide reductase subunit B [Desulfovibrio sp.]|nr:dimethylsulfoxide reductase subunit B [Desulfovibrio sp.]
MYTQPAFYFDATACSGCKTYMVACLDGYDMPASVLWRRVSEYTGGEWAQQDDGIYTQNVFAYYMSVSCNHCLNPVCVQACPTTAMNKNKHDIVSVDQNKCVGCRYCEMNCPYSAPQYNSDLGKMTKCNFCYERQIKGLAPLCVEACPLRALKFGEYEDLKKQYGDKAHTAPLPDPTIAKPCLVLNPARSAKPVSSSAGMVSNPEEI